MDQPPSLPKPRRGAPRGNKNALKHGFYARNFDKIDLADLKTVSFDGLNDEITMLRVFMRRLTERFQSTEDLSAALAVVRALSIASFSLARLVHLQCTMAPSASDKLYQAIEQILPELQQERPASTASGSAAPSNNPPVPPNDP
jgi:hypothetical protein